MNAYPYSQEPDNTLAASFQKLCQVMLDGSSKNLNKKNVEDFRVILHIIMRECSKANIESGKTWVFDHCQTPVHATVLMEYILALSKSRTGPEDRIHMIYLLNDILFHTARKQMTWMRDAMLPLLVPLLKLAYNAAQNPEQQAKIMKVITFWGDKQVFESSIINSIKRDVVGNNYADQQQQNRTPIDPQTYRRNQQQMPYQQQPPPPTTMQPAMFRPQPPQHQSSPYTAPQYQPPPQTPGQQYSSRPPYQQSSHISPTSSPAVSYKQYTNPMRHPKPAPGNQFQQINPPPSTVLPPTPPQKPYHQLPAGLMLLAKSENYSPIDPSDIKVPFPCPLPTKEIAEAVEEFYKGLDLSNSDDVLLDDKNESRIDAQGWEKGYLDRYMNAAAQRKIDAIARQELYKRRSTSREERRGRSPPRGNARQSRSRSPSYHRRRSYSRSRSRSPPHGRRISPNRGRSPPRRRERSPPRRGRSPSGYNRRRYSRSRSRSPPPYSSNAYYGSNNSGNMNYDPPASTENRYMGLGSNSKADEFDSFRKSRSQAYSKRESYQPFMCYKCNKPGHLARECNSL